MVMRYIVYRELLFSLNGALPAIDRVSISGFCKTSLFALGYNFGGLIRLRRTVFAFFF